MENVYNDFSPPSQMLIAKFSSKYTAFTEADDSGLSHLAKAKLPNLIRLHLGSQYFIKEEIISEKKQEQ